MLMSELAHMRKLYNDIIYFVQNHVKPVAPSNVSYNNYPSSLVVCNPSPTTTTTTAAAANAANPMVQKSNSNQIFGYNNYTKQVPSNGSDTKLFGVQIQSSKKRLHPDHHRQFSASQSIEMMNNKARLVSEKHDLGLNLSLH